MRFRRHAKEALELLKLAVLGLLATWSIVLLLLI